MEYLFFIMFSWQTASGIRYTYPVSNYKCLKVRLCATILQLSVNVIQQNFVLHIDILEGVTYIICNTYP